MRRIPVHYGPVKLDGEYDGWEAEIRLNPPASVVDGLSDPVRVYDSVVKMVKHWNFVDEDGLDLAVTSEDVGKLPIDCISNLINKWAAARQLPPTTAGS